jgi:hypothetical protein
MLQYRSTTTAPYGPTSHSNYERELVHHVDQARTRDPGSDTTVRAAPPNQSSQNSQVLGGAVGPLAPDQHSPPF